MVALSVSRMCRNRDTAVSAVACCALWRTCSFLSHPSLCMAQGGKFCSLVHSEFCVKTLHLGIVSVCLAWSSPLPRYCCLLIASIAIWKSDICFILSETGNWRSTGLEYEVHRIIVSAATVQSVARRLLVVKRAIPLFHVGMKKLQRWNHLNGESNSSCLQRRRRRDTCVVLDFSPRETQKETHFDMSETT